MATFILLGTSLLDLLEMQSPGFVSAKSDSSALITVAVTGGSSLTDI